MAPDSIPRRSTLQLLGTGIIGLSAGCASLSAPRSTADTENTPVASPNEESAAPWEEQPYFVFKNLHSSDAYEFTLHVLSGAVSQYDVVYGENNTTGTFDEVPGNVSVRTTSIKPSSNVLTVETYLTKPQSATLVEVSGSSDGIRFFFSFREEGRRYLNGWGEPGSGCSGPETNYYEVGPNRSKSGHCGDYRGEIDDDSTDYRTLTVDSKN